MSVPRPYDIVSDIVATLSTGDISQHKSALLTLHFLFPHELVPALDLLDRKLVTRLVVSSSQKTEQENEIYYVQSASATASRPSKSSRHHMSTTTAYEVRLSAWNCSCPAFAYSAFGKGFQATMNLDGDQNTCRDHEELEGAASRIGLGGVLTQAEAGVPICKHILAAFLGAAAPVIFGNGVCTREVDEVEAAGWAGGWGD
jgi:hypothetical protein